MITKRLLLISALLFVAIGIIALIQTQKEVSTPSPTPFLTPTPIPASFPSSAPVPQNLEDEKTKQENYAKSRQEEVSAKPWIYKLPLKSSNYFISYDPETDTILATLYYSQSSEVPKDQQIEKAKNDSLVALQNASIDTEKQNIQFLETALK